MDVRVERTIPRPAEEVFAYFANAANNPEWQQGMKSCTWLTPEPIGVGSRYEQVAEFMGRPIISVFEVTEYEPGRHIRIETIKSTFPIQVTRRVDPIDDGSCRVSADISGGPGGLLRLLSPLTDRMATKSINADYDRLVAKFD